MEQLKHFVGKGLYRLIQEGLQTYSDAEKVAAEISSGTYGQSLIWKINWKTDGDENAIEGTYNVYQKIMHEPKVLDVYTEAVKSPTQYARELEEQCKAHARDQRLSDKITSVNNKVNYIIAIGMVLVGVAIWGWLYYATEYPAIECLAAVLIPAFLIVSILWVDCTISCDTRRE